MQTIIFLTSKYKELMDEIGLSMESLIEAPLIQSVTFETYDKIMQQTNDALHPAGFIGKMGIKVDGRDHLQPFEPSPYQTDQLIDCLFYENSIVIWETNEDAQHNSIGKTNTETVLSVLGASLPFSELKHSKLFERAYLN